MKIIKPNNLKIEKFVDKPNLETTSNEILSSLLEINPKHIQHISSEQSSGNNLLKCFMHPFIQAVHYAYSYHLALNITPDMIWYLIAQAIANHLSKFSNGIKKELIYKEKLKLKHDQRPDGQITWDDSYEQFETMINSLPSNEISNKLKADFTTTNKHSKIVSQIVLTETVQKYFEFGITTMCGIPELRISGSKQDWLNIKNKTNHLVHLVPDLSIWLKNIYEILNNFIDVFDDRIDTKFWNSIYKIEGGSGGPYLSGWSIALFPYLAKEEQNKYLLSENFTWTHAETVLDRIKTNSFFYHLNQIPFIWECNESFIDMLLIGGMIGIKCDTDDNDSLTPIFGYAVIEENKSNEEED